MYGSISTETTASHLWSNSHNTERSLVLSDSSDNLESNEYFNGEKTKLTKHYNQSSDDDKNFPDEFHIHRRVTLMMMLITFLVLGLCVTFYSPVERSSQTSDTIYQDFGPSISASEISIEDVKASAIANTLKSSVELSNSNSNTLLIDPTIAQGTESSTTTTTTSSADTGESHDATSSSFPELKSGEGNESKIFSSAHSASVVSTKSEYNIDSKMPSVNSATVVPILQSYFVPATAFTKSPPLVVLNEPLRSSTFGESVSAVPQTSEDASIIYVYR